MAGFLDNGWHRWGALEAVADDIPTIREPTEHWPVRRRLAQAPRSHQQT